MLRELRATLKSRGVLFSSNPRGDNEEGWNRGRYGAYHDLEVWRRFVTAAGFAELEHHYRPEGLRANGSPGSRACGAGRLHERSGRDRLERGQGNV